MSRPVVSRVAEDAYEALEPGGFTTHDAELGWPLLHYVAALVWPIVLVDEWAATDETVVDRDVLSGPGHPGWSLLLDVDRAPDEALPWLGQFVGVRLPPGESDPVVQREMIRATPGWKRGTREALTAAVQRTLTGERRVIVRERYDGVRTDPAYQLRVTTIADETPDPDATRAAILEHKPAGVMLDFEALPSADYQSVIDNYADYAELEATVDDYEALRGY